LVGCRYSNRKQTFTTIAIVVIAAARDTRCFRFMLNDSITSTREQTVIVIADFKLNPREMAWEINSLDGQVADGKSTSKDAATAAAGVDVLVSI